MIELILFLLKAVGTVLKNNWLTAYILSINDLQRFVINVSPWLIRMSSPVRKSDISLQYHPKALFSGRSLWALALIIINASVGICSVFIPRWILVIIQKNRGAIPLFCYFSIFQHDDMVTYADKWKLVRNDQACTMIGDSFVTVIQCFFSYRNSPSLFHSRQYYVFRII